MEKVQVLLTLQRSLQNEVRAPKEQPFPFHLTKRNEHKEGERFQMIMMSEPLMISDDRCFQIIHYECEKKTKYNHYIY